ncbi:hypothetical protein TNCV_3562011 [Trichonephila clavipes]|nr:hypothetical protein TNCV_3562011 [Trichonephila clavipes]
MHGGGGVLVPINSWDETLYFSFANYYRSIGSKNVELSAIPINFLSILNFKKLKHNNLVGSIKYGGGSVVAWGCKSATELDSAPQLACDLAAVPRRRISRQTLYSRLAESILYARRPMLCIPLTTPNRKGRIFVELKTLVEDTTRMGRVLFRHESKSPRQSDSRRVFTWRENEARFHHPYVKKSTHLGSKESLCVMA